MSDKVNHPNHYNHGRIEVAVAMDILGDPSQWLGHALKYACRAPHKGKLEEDIRKALWCAEHAMSLNAQWPAHTNATQKMEIVKALTVGVPNGCKWSMEIQHFIASVVRYDGVTHRKELSDATYALEERLRVEKVKAESTPKAEVTKHADELCKADPDLKSQVAQFQSMIGIAQVESPAIPSSKVVERRLRLITEEFFEVLAAAFPSQSERFAHDRQLIYIAIHGELSAPDWQDNFDLPSFTDGLADLDFVVEGTRQEFGIDGGPIALEVYRANMAKQAGPVDDKTGKKLKPEGWTPPDIAGKLREQGWR